MNGLKRAATATVIVATVVVATAASLTTCDSTARPPKQLTIATGGIGGVYNLLGTALAQAMRQRWSSAVTVMTTAASIENIMLLDQNRVDLAFATVDSAALGLAGSPPFDRPIKIAAIAGLYEDYLQIVVREESPIFDVPDLRSRRVSTGSPGSGTEVVADRILSAAGIDINKDIRRSRLSVADSAAALRNGAIDAFFFTGGLPTPAVADLAKTTQVRLISIEKYLPMLQDAYGDVYQPRSIPPFMYELGSQVATIGITNVLLVRADMPEATAYQLTSILFAARAELIAAHPEARRLNPSSALSTLPVPLQPGAARYYRDNKP
jgi:TRAP transporter TAXI family solute receptor